MPRQLLWPVLAAITLASPPAAGCKEAEPPPDYSPRRMDDQPDAAPDRNADTGGRSDAGREPRPDEGPRPLPVGTTPTAVAGGWHHTCALLATGDVKCWGDNTNGQLGLGDTAHRGDMIDELGDGLPAVDLGADRTATALAAGVYHTCALLDTGQVKCWGLNVSGMLGLGDVESRGDAAGETGDALPAVDLGTGRTATALVARGDHACALLDTGEIKCWGRNAHGQLGVGDTDNRGDVAGEMGDPLPVIDLGS